MLRRILVLVLLWPALAACASSPTTANGGVAVEREQAAKVSPTRVPKAAPYVTGKARPQAQQDYGAEFDAWGERQAAVLRGLVTARSLLDSFIEAAQADSFRDDEDARKSAELVADTVVEAADAAAAAEPLPDRSDHARWIRALGDFKLGAKKLQLAVLTDDGALTQEALAQLELAYAGFGDLAVIVKYGSR